MAQADLGDQMAIVGVGATNYADLYERRGQPNDPYYLAAAAFREAVEDSGVDRAAIDGLVCVRLPNYERMGNVIGLHQPRVVHSLEGSGRMSAVAVQHAVALIRAGLATTVACVYGNNGRSAQARYGGEGGGPTVKYDTMHGMTSPGAYVGLMYRRYQHLYGAPDNALAPLAINNRRHAGLNPAAVMKKPVTEQEYLDSRYIAEPLRLLDYCIINDGGVALIVTTLDRARSLRQPPVKIAATASRGNLTNFYTSEDLFYGGCAAVASDIYRQSGLGPSDMDCLQIYDNFTPTALFSLEGFGHCGRGEAWQLVREKTIGFDGDLPVNTSGGHTGESYMQGWALHVEAVRQIRGECGPRQVPGCRTVQYVCASPIIAAHILTSDEA